MTLINFLKNKSYKQWRIKAARRGEENNFWKNDKSTLAFKNTYYLK